MDFKQLLLYISIVLNVIWLALLMYLLSDDAYEWKFQMLAYGYAQNRNPVLEDGIDAAQYGGDEDSYLLNLPGCKIKRYRAFDEEVLPFYREKEALKCGPSFAFAHKRFITVDKAGMADHFGVSEQDIECSLYKIHRFGEKTDKRFVSELIMKIKKRRFRTEDDTVQITCFLNGTNVIYEDFFAVIQSKDEADLKCKDRCKKDNDSENTTKKDELFNVVFVALDGVSRVNFMRHLPKTYLFLQEAFDVLDYRGYTKLGENTLPSLLPLLAGKLLQEMPYENGPFDNASLIWKDFSAKGYRTLYGEDRPKLTMFNYKKKGFYRIPTDYYLRPFYLAVQRSFMRKFSKRFCFNSRPQISVVLQWLQDFMDHFSRQPKFAFVMITGFTHGTLNNAGYCDTPMRDFFKWYRKMKHGNNTFLVFFSDHGMRYGKFRQTLMGAYEESLPFFYLLPPVDFIKKYPQRYNNLKQNQRRLVTMFDVHKMLKSILDFGGVTEDNRLELKTITGIRQPKSSRGISLFEELPKNRTCEDAGIPLQYCMCYERKRTDVNSSIAAIAQRIVDKINAITSEYGNLCAELKLQGPVSVSFYKFIAGSERGTDVNMTTYIISLSTAPNDAIFESALLCESHSMKNCSITGDIKRTNSYGAQSKCVEDAKMKNYCYCQQNK